MATTWDDFPTVDEAPKNSLSWDAFPDAKEEPMIDISDTLSAAGQAIGGVTTTAPHAFRQLYSGLDNPWRRSEGYIASQDEMDRLNEETEAANQAAVESGDISQLSRGMRQAGQSLGFSAGAMGAGLVGSSATGTAGRYIGGIAGPEGAIAGEAIGRGVGALGSGYGAAYRMAGAQFLDDARKEIDAKFQEKLGRLPNELEQKEAYDELLPLAQAFGHAEAGPEAIGNLAMAKAGKFIFGLGKKKIVGMAANALQKTGAAAGSLATELGGETVTQVEQKRLDEQKNAFLNGQAPPVQGDRTVDEYKTALGEVAPATLATMGLLGSIPATFKGVSMVKNSLTPKEKAEIPAAIQPEVESAQANVAAAANEGLTPLTAAALNDAIASTPSVEPSQGAADFEEALTATEQEGADAEITTAQMVAQEEAQAAAEAQQRQAQYDSLAPNEQPIEPAAGIPIPQDGAGEVTNLEAGNGDIGNLGEPVLPEAQPETLESQPSESVVGASNPAITALAQQAAAINAGTAQGPNLNFPQVSPSGAAPTGIATTTPVEMVPLPGVLPGGDAAIPMAPKKPYEKAIARLKNQVGENVSLIDMQRIHSAVADGHSPEAAGDFAYQEKLAHYMANDAVDKALKAGLIESGKPAQDLYEQVYGQFAPQPLSPAATPTQETPLTPSGQVANEGVVPGTSAEMEVGGRSNTPVETKVNADVEASSGKVEAGNAALDDIISKLPAVAQAKYTPEVRAKAAKFFETKNEADLKGLTTIQKTKVHDALYRADKEAADAQKAADKLYEKRLREEEKENARLEKERANQVKLTESRRKSYDSIIGTPSGVEMGAVSPTDGQEALAAVHNAGDVPGVLNAFVGTSSEFLANAENEKNYPALWQLLQTGRVDEGNFVYGRAFVFTDGIGINRMDRENAARYGTTPAVAAVRRVLVHESLVHRGIFGLPAHLQARIIQWVMQNTSPEQLDMLAKDYPQYENWRGDEFQMLALAEEYLAKTVESINGMPKIGPIAHLVEILRDIWRWMTGSNGDPTIQNLRDVVKLLKAGAQAADARLVNGGKVDIRESKPAFATPINAELARAAERFRQMQERQSVPTPEGLKELFNPNSEGSGTQNKLFEQQVTPQQIRNEIRAAYDRALVGQGSVQVSLQRVFDEAKAQMPTLTEKQFGEQVQALYEDGSAFLVPTDRGADMLADGEKWGVYDVSGMPASYVGVLPAEIKSSKVQRDTDAAIHSARGITGKVNKIVNGLPANSYTGKPLQDAMSQSFAPLGSQQFYDETKALIVGAIDDMIKRGIDPGNVLETVIQPDFTEEAMKGWNESAKSVAKSIYFNHGLLLATQKHDQLLDEGNLTEANRQQDKIDAWSKFWFNYTNNFGVTGNAIQRGMEDPAYQGLYLLSNFKSQTQKNQQDVTDANIADPNAVAKDINDVGKKSKDDTDTEVSDALTGIQVEDEIAAGEAVLTPENRTLWERAKAILRSLARIAKAESFFASKGIKASNAAESSDEEVARYIQMGPKGVGTLKQKLQKEFGGIVAKLTGTEKTAKPRKPRTPKEEAAHPLIVRMVARTAAKLNAGTNLDAALAALMPESPSYNDRIIGEIVSGIVGRVNKSLKKPQPPAFLTDLTNQLKKVLSENIKAEPLKAANESLGRKAIRAFRYAMSNEDTVERAWNEARAKVRSELAKLDEAATPDQIETRLNTLMGEVPSQLYSTSQARSVIRESLEGTKFDNSKAILENADEAKNEVLSKLSDAALAEGEIDAEQWNLAKPDILRAFDALVADLQKARDEGIAASNKALRDAVFGVDAQKALKIIMRKLTAARPGIDAPLAPSLAWKRLFEMTQTDQGELKGRMFDIVKDEPAFSSLDNADKQRLANILEKAWDSRREQMLTKELERLRRKYRQRMTGKAAKVFDQRPAILRKLDSGVFDYSDLAALVGEEYGIRQMTPAETKRAKEISDRLSDDLSPHLRTKLQEELQQLMVSKKLSMGEMLKSWWISSVLSGARTAFTIGWSFMSGGYELMGHAASVLLNKDIPIQQRVDAVSESIKNWWSRLAPEVRNAFLYVATGDKTIQDPSALMQSSFFDNQFRKEMGRFSFSTAEKMIGSKNPAIRGLGWFMTYGGRILNALDAFNFNITKAASAPLVYSMLNNSYKAGSFNTSTLFKSARQKIIDMDYGGNVPSDTSRLDAWARNSAYQELAKLTGMAENMNQVARQGNFTLEPTGFGGWLYNGLKFADAFLQKKSEAFVVRMKQDLLRNDGAAFDKVLVGIAELVQSGAMQTLPILGLQFAKFALNKLNQTISFIPIAGLIRLKESGVEGYRVHQAMIWRNQAVGTLLFSFVYFTLKAIEDEPDDEERGWGIEGGWSNLTPQEKRQRDASGLKENTIWWRDKNGKRTVMNFINWPISPVLAAAGAMSDQIKYSPDKWQEGGILKRGVTMGWAMGKSVSETSALSQFTELFGSSIASRDPVEAFANKAARIFGGYAGGYIPRIFKDIDRNMQPEIRKYEGWEYLGKELPFFRSYIGKEYLDIFGNTIAPSQTPWSREFVHQPAKAEYTLLSRLNSHGLWLTPAVSENRLVGPRNHKRPMTNEEADRYIKTVGKGYSELVTKYGEKLLTMPKERAKELISKKADDIRDKSAKLAVKRS